MIGTLLGAAATFMAQMLSARMLGPAAFGVFSGALASANFLGPIALFGVSGFWLKVFGQEGAAAERWVASSLRLCTYATVGSVALLLAMFVLQPDGELRLVGLLLLPVIGAYVAVSLLISRHQVEGDYLKVAFWLAAPHGVRLAAVAALALLPAVASTPLLAAVYGAIALLIVARFIATTRIRIPCIGSRPTVISVAKQSWQFGLDGVLYLAYHQLGVVIVMMAAGKEAAGVFSAAFIFLNAAYMFPSIIFQKYLLPKLHRWSSHSPSTLLVVAKQGSTIMFAAGLAVAFFVHILASNLILLVFGSEYMGGAEILRILAFAIPFKFAGSSLGSVLTSGRLLNMKIMIMGVGSLTYMPLCFVLARSFGLKGAAIATVMVEAMLLFGFALVARLRLKEVCRA